MDKLNKLNNQLEFINNEIEDIIEDLKHNLEFIEIDKINLLNYHYQLNNLLTKKQLIENEIFNIKMYN